MKKNYFSTFFAALMLLVAMPAKAQVSSIEELFGKYQFTATITPTAEGQSYTDYWKSECEVTIKKEDGQNSIIGLLGSQEVQWITDIDNEKFWVNNPNPNYGLLSTNPFIGVADLTLENLQLYTMEYYYNSTTKVITIPDFSICEFSWAAGGVMTAKELAKVTNATLTFIGGEEESAVTDLSGDWHFVAGDGEYDTMAGSTLPTEWDMTLTATDEFNKTYDATFKLGDFEPLTLSATFDGQTLTISFNEDYLDLEKKIGFVNMYGDLRPGEIAFTLENENLLKLGNSGITIYDELKEENLQWYLAGVATRSVAEEEEAFDWVGTYIVTVGEIEVANEAYTYPETFEMEIAYDEYYNEYYVAKLFGKDLYNLWYYGNGIVIAPSAEETNKATIKTISDYGQSVYLQDLGSGVYLKMLDANEGTNPLNLEINEDGTISIDNFKVMIENNASYPATVTPAATYKNVTAVKKGSENGIENTVVENNTLEGIFDLLGRKLDAITAPGLYIVNGKKVVIK